jgi:tripartite-type tricarboxylate transporter receptor subunit TctC
VQSGKLRALAVTSGKRATALPDVPTLAEAGVNGSEIHEWNAIFAPAGTPDAVLEKLSDALIKAMDTPEVKARIAQLGGEVQKGGPKAAQDFIQAQMALWARVVKGKGIVLE